MTQMSSTGRAARHVDRLREQGTPRRLAVSRGVMWEIIGSATLSGLVAKFDRSEIRGLAA